jgi:hypothetical protein
MRSRGRSPSASEERQIQDRTRFEVLGVGLLPEGHNVIGFLGLRVGIPSGEPGLNVEPFPKGNLVA